MQKRKIVSLVTLLFVFVSFQNCSPENFSNRNPSSLSSGTPGSGPAILIEGGRSATNKQILNVQFMNIPQPNPYIQMRLAEKSQFSSSLAQQPFAANTTVDLSKAFASDGSKDTSKTIVAELSTGVVGSTPVQITAQILLDTIPPSGVMTGILKNGIPGGSIYTLNQTVPLAWQAQDSPSAVTKSMSGLDPQHGVRIGWSKTANCSAGIQYVTDWQPNTNAFSDFPWQAETPADTFYVCIFVQDLAGNISPMLSQPMTSVWKVVAGDNNPGDGGSANGSKVRFNYPAATTVDSQNNVYIADSFLNTIRVISGQTGVISLFAGTGTAVGPTAGDATLSGLAGPAGLSVDAQDRIYTASGGVIVRLTPQPNGHAILERWLPIGGVSALTIDRTPSPLSKSGTIYFSYLGNKYSTNSQSYIFKIPIDQFDTQKAAPSLATLIANYKFAGSGCSYASSVLNTTYAQTRDAVNDCVDLPTALAYDGHNTLYFATTSGAAISTNALRKITPDATTQQLQNIWVGAAPGQVGPQMEYVQTNDSHGVVVSKSLVYGGAFGGGLRQYDLVKNVQTTIDPYSQSSFHSGVSMAVAQFQRSSLSVPPRFVTADSSNSRVSILNSDFTLASSLGRAVYNAQDLIATEAMINNPAGIAQDKAGNIYFFEALSGVMRKVDPTGNITLLAGTPNVQAQSSLSPASFAATTFNGLPYVIGFLFPLVYSPDDNALFLNEGGSNRIRKLDLSSQQSSFFGPSTAVNASDAWGGISLAIAPAVGSVATKGLVVARYLNTLPVNKGQIDRYSGPTGAASNVVAGNGVGTTPVVGPAASSPMSSISGMAIDSAGNLFLSDPASGIYKVDPTSSKITQISNRGFVNIVLFENEVQSSPIIHVIGLNFTGLYHFTTDGVTTSAVDQLCVPGSFINGARQVTKTNDGNLLLTDSHSNRILEYFIRNGANQLSFSVCK